MSEDYGGLEADHSDIDGESSSGSVSSGGTDATSIHSNDSGPCAESDNITQSIQSHASDFKFTDAELWKLHTDNRATIPGATGPPGTRLPQVETVSCGADRIHIWAQTLRRTNAHTSGGAACRFSIPAKIGLSPSMLQE